jgi:hypothetical protein
MRPLDAAFKSLPGQAQEARLSFVQPASLDSDYGHEALDRFKQLAEVSRSWLYLVFKCSLLNELRNGYGLGTQTNRQR